MTAFDPCAFLSALDFESAASAALPQATWDYFRSGAGDETTLRWNDEGWERLRIQYRVMADVSKRDASSRVLGASLPFPMLIAPTALHKLAHPEGELATARAASSMGCPLVLSSLSSVSVEEVCAATKAPVWMQLYIGKDRDFTIELAERARRAGCTALVVTVDTPIWGVRERDVRNRWCLPEGIDVVNLLRAGLEGSRGHSGAGIGEALGWTIDASLAWRDLTWLADRMRMPILVKGVCRGDDARRALDHGARGVIVSNHGGRQLDGAPPTSESLPEVAAAIGGRAALLVDGGIRRGIDILRAVALGANAVLVGRPILWGLGVAGEAGVRRVLELFRDEFDRAMALSGCRNIGEITRDLVR